MKNVFAGFEMMAFDATEQVNLTAINAKSVSTVMEECNSVFFSRTIENNLSQSALLCGITRRAVINFHSKEISAVL